MSKFEINRITIELIRAILRFRFTSLAPLSGKSEDCRLWAYQRFYQHLRRLPIMGLPTILPVGNAGT